MDQCDFGGNLAASPAAPTTTAEARRTGRARDRADKRELILEAAARVFGYSGYAKASVDEIAKRAGVGKGTVYQIAESKEELFMLAVEREIRVWHEAIEPLIDENVPAEELLVSVEAQAMNSIHENALLRDLFCGETANMLARCETRLRGVRSVGARHLAAILRIGIKQGVWREELDPEVVAEMLQDMWIGAWMLEPSFLTPEAQMQRVATGLDIVLHGLRKR